MNTGDIIFKAIIICVVAVFVYPFFLAQKQEKEQDEKEDKILEENADKETGAEEEPEQDDENEPDPDSDDLTENETDDTDEVPDVCRSLILKNTEDGSEYYETGMTDERAIIGKGEEADLRLEDNKGVSGVQCEIYWDGAAYRLINLSEKYPVWIGDEKTGAGEEREVENGTVITLGEKEYRISFRESVQGTDTVTAP